MKETHLFILLENARYKENEILEDIKQNFNIIGMYNITWNKEIFSKIFQGFMGQTFQKILEKNNIVEIENSC